MADKKTNTNQEVTEKTSIVKAILACLEGSGKVSEYSTKLQAAKAKKLRLENELVVFNERKIELEQSITKVKEGFGEDDSFADMEQLEQLEIKLKTVTESIPLIQKNFLSNSVLRRSFEDLQSGLQSEIQRSLKGFTEQLQERLDSKIAEIEIYFADIAEAVVEATSQQKVVHKSENMLVGRVLRGTAPKLDSDKLKPYMDDPFYDVHLAARVRNNLKAA